MGRLRTILTTAPSRASALLLFLWLTIIAPASPAQRYPFYNIGIEEGLVQSQVIALAQDHAGHLWAATLGGLACYDGHQFRSYTVRDGLPSNIVTALHTDARGLLWIGTSRGLSSYDGHRFVSYPCADTTGNGSRNVTQITATTDGKIWWLAGQKLYNMNHSKAALVAVPSGYANASALLALKDGGLLVAPHGAGALYRMAARSKDSILLPAMPRPMLVYKMYEQASGNIVLITAAGIYRSSTDGWELIIPRRKHAPLFYCFAQAADGSYWAGSTSGVIRFANGAEQHYTRSNGATDLMVSDLLQDREGNLWLASNGEGLYRFSGATFTAVDERMGLTGPQVSNIAQDKTGTVYFGSFDGGLYRYTNGCAKPILFPGNYHVPVTSLLMQDDVLWIAGQDAGLWQYNTISGKMLRYNDEQPKAAIISLLADSSSLLAASAKSIIRISDGKRSALKLPKITIDAIEIIGTDSLLIATPDGLLLYHNGGTRPFKTGSAADSGQIVCMDYRSGIVWMGTSDNGVLGYNMHTRKTVHISRPEGMRSPFVYNIYATESGDVWAGTGFGICRIRISGDRPQVSFYGRSAGLVGMESNRNAVLPVADGSIWFGTTGGAVLYHPGERAAATMPVSLVMQSVRLFGEAIHDTSWYNGTSPIYGVPQSLRLPWRQNNLSFSFAAVSLTGGEDILYRYRLDGLQTPWSEWNSDNTVTLSALPPGRYTLLVECSTDKIHAQPQSLKYPFEIITPFHKTVWFSLLIVGGCIALGVAIQYGAAARKRRRAAMIEVLRREEGAKVRQRTAEDFHDEVGNRLTRINVLTNVLRSKVGSPAPTDVGRLIDSIQENAAQLYGGTRDILWSLQPANDSLYQVLQRIRDFGYDLFGDTEVAFRMEGIEPAWKEYRLPMDMSRNLIMIFKEALNNTLKHAMADVVRIEAKVEENILLLSLVDDGKGFDQHCAEAGQGLGNMTRRAIRLGGTLELKSSPGSGTEMQLRMHIKQT